jgi:hypothetical protein
MKWKPGIGIVLFILGFIMIASEGDYWPYVNLLGCVQLALGWFFIIESYKERRK